MLIIGYIYNIIGNVICKQIYNKITDNLDILYTNMIGPEKKIFMINMIIVFYLLEAEGVIKILKDYWKFFQFLKN